MAVRFVTILHDIVDTLTDAAYPRNAREQSIQHSVTTGIHVHRDNDRTS